jgi:hypothetical protein
MSYQAVEWALEIPCLRPPVKLVLVALAERANAEGTCFPSITNLSKRASTSRRRVIAAIRELEVLDAITVSRSACQSTGRRPVNQYQLHVGRTIEVPRKPRKKGTTLVPQWNRSGSPDCTVTIT